MKYEILNDNGEVINTIVAGLEFIEQHFPNKYREVLGSSVEPLAYKAQRAAEYPPVADYLDGIVKGDSAQVQAYIDACLAVKAKYPKPE